MILYQCNVPFWKFQRNAQIGQNPSLTSHDSRGFQISPNGTKFERIWNGDLKTSQGFL